MKSIYVLIESWEQGDYGERERILAASEDAKKLKELARSHHVFAGNKMKITKDDELHLYYNHSGDYHDLMEKDEMWYSEFVFWHHFDIQKITKL